MKKSAKLKLIIVAIIILLLILLATIINLHEPKTKNKAEEQVQNNNTVSYAQEEPATLYMDTRIKEIETTSLLLAVQNAINQYYDYINLNDAAAIMDILDDSYSKENGITEANCISNLKKLNSKQTFYATKAYSKEISYGHEYKYWVIGKAYTDDFKYQIEQFTLNMDLFNKTFKITPLGSSSESAFESNMENLKLADDGEKKVVDGIVTSIEANEHNKYTSYSGIEGIEKTIENYAKYYYMMEVTNPQEAYNLLDDEYKAIKFGSFENYKKSKLMWKDIDIEYVRKTGNDNAYTYIGIDKKGTYYIFKEKSPMNFTVILDSYTVPLEETVKKYNESTDMEKACMCVKNVEEMVNNKDYKTMYKLMNSIFKMDKYETQSSFEEYINNNYYESNKFDLLSYTLSGDNYIINVKVSDVNDENKSFKTTYVIKLNKDLTSFEYSFSQT